jgi:hypothetical protein
MSLELGPSATYDQAVTRALASDERAILRVLLTKEFEGRDEIEAQLASVTVEPIPGDPISLRLRVAKDAPRATVRSRVPTDAFGYDAAGNLVGILLHILDGYANELEFFAAESDLRPGLPVPDTVKIGEWSEPDSSGLRVMQNSPPSKRSE